MNGLFSSINNLLTPHTCLYIFFYFSLCRLFMISLLFELQHCILIFLHMTKLTYIYCYLQFTIISGRSVNRLDVQSKRAQPWRLRSLTTVTMTLHHHLHPSPASSSCTNGTERHPGKKQFNNILRRLIVYHLHSNLSITVTVTVCFQSFQDIQQTCLLRRT